MQNTVKILFVCHGNICRSPTAEFVMKDIVERAGRSADFEIASAATSTEELGNPVYEPARQTLARHGISCGGKYARQMSRADCNYYDFIIAMDKNNLRNISRICGADALGKVRLLMSYSGQPDGEVDDPWYTGGFEAAFADISAGCRGLFDALK